MHKFVAEKAPSDSSCVKIEAIAPHIPYYTKEYRDALQICGREVWLLGEERDGNIICGSLGEMEVGRIRKQLHIQSTPSNPTQYFWAGLDRFCRRERVTTLSLGTIGTSPEMPRIGRVLSEKDRCEYWVDLCKPDFEMTFRPQQRRVLRKARRKGLEVRIPDLLPGLKVHNSLTRHSLCRRRERGERIPQFDNSDLPQALLEVGAARIFECVLDGDVLGSVIISVAEKGAHGYSAGYSEAGMKSGAAVFLSEATFQSLKDDGKSVFNLGDAPRDSGLAVFKRGLGAALHESRSRIFDTASPVRRVILNAYSSIFGLRSRPG